VALLPGGLSVRTAPPPATPGSTTSAVTNYAAPAGWDLFAAGTANGHPWRLNVSDVADSGGACIPAVVLNGQDADLLLPPSDNDLIPPAGAPSVLTGTTDAPGASFAFFRVPPSVTRLVVSAGPTMRLTLTPVTETVCGQRFRLAGFGFDSAEPVRITAYPAGAGYVLPSSLIKPSPSPQQLDGSWQNLDLSAGPGTPRLVSGGTIAGHPWNIDLRLGDQGECFSLNVPGAAHAGSPPACGMLIVGGNQPLYELVPVVTGTTMLYGYAFPLGAQDCSQVSVKLADGQTVTVPPVTVSGLRLVAVATAAPMTGITFKDAAGKVLSTDTFSPPG
jgi:hypothetical protein